MQIHESWKIYLEPETEKEYFQHVKKFLMKEVKDGNTFYPHPKNIFNAFDTCHFDNLKVVILGQDPYHGAGQAHGLSFSVSDDVKQPPSLQNIFKELREDLNVKIPQSGSLTRWATQGVLLLNAGLTVRAGEANSHADIGWHTFTDKAIETISNEKENVVFLLWGRFAQNKAELIDGKKHLVLKAAHPSPFSAYNGFFGCKHFSQANEYLKKNGKKEITW